MKTINKRDPQTYAIIGAVMEVHKRLGHGFLEAVYQEAAALEFSHQNIPFQREVQLPITYRDTVLPTAYRADFICFSNVIVEFKALSRLSTTEEAQVLNYLKAMGYQRALLINFGTTRLEYKRLVWGYPNKKSAPSIAASA